MTTMTPESNEGTKKSLVKWIVVAVVVLAVLGGGTFLVQNREVKRLEAGRDAIAEGDWETAVTALNDALAVKPAFLQRHTAEASALRGFAHYQLGDDEAALADSDAALSVTTDFVDVLAYRAMILYRQGKREEARAAAEVALEHEDLLPPYLLAQLRAQSALTQPVSAEIEAALALSDYLPDEMWAELMAERARLAFADGDAEAGLANADQLVFMTEFLPDELWGGLLAEKTAVYHQQGNDQAALAASDEALKLADALPDETLADLYAVRADIAYRQGDWAQAVAEAEQAASYVDDLALPHALLAWQQYRQFDWDGAVETAEAALALDEEAALAYRVRGAVALWNGRYDDAFADLNRAIELDPEDAEALALRANLNFMTSHREDGKADAARAAELAPNAPAGLWAQATAAYFDYEEDQAYALLTQAIALDDQRPELYDWRTATYLYAFQDDERQADVAAALALYPDFGPAIITQLKIQLGRYEDDALADTVSYLLEAFPDWDEAYRMAAFYQKEKMDDLEQALAYVEQAIALNPHGHHNYLAHGDILEDQGELELALADYEHALEIAPDSASVLASLSWYYAGQEEMETAVSYMEQAYTLSNDLYYKAALANAYAGNGDLKTAWQMVHEILAVDPKRDEALVSRVHLLLDSDLSAPALDDLAVLIGEFPNHAYAHLLRARIMLNDGRLEEARQSANRALALDPVKMGSAHYVLMMAALAEEDLETAVTHVDAFVAAEPDNDFNYSMQAELYLNQERIDDALAAIEAGLALEGDATDILYLDRAQAYLLNEDEEAARADLAFLLEDGTDIGAVSRAETMLYQLDTMPQLVDGRRTYVDDAWGYSLSYANGWIQEALDDDLFKLSLSQTTKDGNAVFLVGILTGVSGATSSDLASAVENSLAGNPSFITLSLEPAQVAGRSGLVRHYQLTVTDDFGNPVALRGRQYYLVVGDTAVLLSMETDQAIYDSFSAEFDAIVASFALLR